MNSSEAYDLIVEMRKTRSRLVKMKILKENPGLKPFALATYHPFWHYNVTKIVPEWAPGDMGAELNEDDKKTNALLNQLHKRTVSGNAARAAITRHMRTLNMKSARLLALILEKSWDCGVSVKTLNTVWPGHIPSHDIQLAEKYVSAKAHWPMLISPKLDGLRCTYRNGQLLSRYGNAFRGLDHLIKLLERPDVAEYQRELDGELIVPGIRFDEISGEIRAFKQCDNVVFHVFDTPGPEDLWDRLSIARAMVSRINSPSFVLVEHTAVHSEAEAEAINAQFMDEGYEGSVLKNPDAPYLDGRSFDWMKIKPKDTVDGTVEGLYEGEGKYVGMVGGLIVDHGGAVTRVGGGLTDEQRRRWWEDKWLIVGKTVELEFQEYTPSGKLRHPRLKYVRGDK